MIKIWSSKFWLKKSDEKVIKIGLRRLPQNIMFYGVRETDKQMMKKWSSKFGPQKNWSRRPRLWDDPPEDMVSQTSFSEAMSAPPGP